MVSDNNSLKCCGGYSCSAASTSATADQRVTRNGSGSFTEVRRRSPGCSQKATALESRPLPRNSCSSRSPTAASLCTDGPSRFRTGAGVSDSQDEDIDDLQDELVLRDAIQHVPDSSAGSEMDGEPDCQVVFAKDGVAIWPSPQTHIPGRLSLTKQYGVMFLSWLPYSKGTLNSDGTFQSVQGESARGDVGHRNQYAIHPMPLREVTTLRKRTPRLGVHYLLLVLRSGLSLPPLYFTYGGIREMLCCLRERSLAVKSVEDPATYLITDAGDPLHRSLVVGYTEAVGVPPAVGDGGSAAEPGSASDMWKGGEEGHPRGVPWKSLSLWGLEGLARLALDTTASLLMPRHEHEGAEEPLGFVPGGEPRSAERAAPAGEAGTSSCREEPRDAGAAGSAASGCAAAPSPEAAESVGSRPGGKGEEECVDASAVTGVGVFELLERVAPEMNAAAMRRQARPPPLLLDEWATYFDEEGRIVDVCSLWRRVFQGGVHSDLRREAWKFLVGVYNQDMTSKQRAELMKQQAEQYAVLKQQWQSISPEQERRWSKWRERRIQVDKDVHRTDRCHPENSAFIPNPRRLRNVLLTYSIFNFDLGYCQGMSDLASPLLYVMQSEEEAFWCFVALMDGWMGGNFDSDQRCVQLQLGALGQLLQLLDPPLWACLGSEQHCSEPSLFGSIAAAPLPGPHHNHAARGGGGMRHADPLAGAGVSMMLLCCFRWVLVMFKREFEFEDVLRLWEAIWANPHTPYFHLYIALAVLVGRRHIIIEQRLDHAGMLQLCNSMTGSIDLDTTLRDAEVLYHYAGDAGREIINSLPPLHFPGAPSTPAEEGGACGQA